MTLKRTPTLHTQIHQPQPSKRLRGGGAAHLEDNGADEDFTEEPFDHEVEDYMNIPEDAAFDAEGAVTDTALTYAGLTDAQRTYWSRPELTEAQRDNRHDINLQWLDIDMISGDAPLPSNPNPNKPVVGSLTGPVPIIRVYGVTEQGYSVAVFIHGFTSYGYFAVPSGFDGTDEGNLETLQTMLNEKLKFSLPGKQQRNEGPPVLGVQYVTDRQNILGFDVDAFHSAQNGNVSGNAQQSAFVKVYVAMPSYVPTLVRVLKEGFVLPGMNDNLNGAVGMSHELQAFECNVPYVLRFMIDREITGAGWLTLPKLTYKVRKKSEKKTHCQLEIDICYPEIIPRKAEGEWNKIAPLRVLSFDIECQGRQGFFPEAEKDPVIQIANTVTIYGESQPRVKNVFTLKGCLPIVGAQVISSDSEADMLLKWRTFLQATDADIITGYNVQNFDIPYLLDRAEALSKQDRKSSMRLAPFKYWGRVKGSPAKMRESTFQSAAYGKRNNVETTIEGRVIFDMLPYMQRNHKLSSYTLNSVCAEFLGQQKEDVHHSIISTLQNGTDEDRHRLAVYCLKDAVLPQRLMDKLNVLVNFVEMARVTGVPMSFLISRGQQIKVFSMILRKCRNVKLLVPTLKKGFVGGENVGYEGATVLDPIKAYYEEPIATLDFASLYPSIMQAYNLCYSTLVSPGDVMKLSPNQYKKTENGNVFVTSNTKKGILPIILEELLTARKRAKKDMKNAETEFEKAVQNGRQLALKVSANSVYGFTGATVGQLPCLPIASSVTSYGRQLLEKTKEFVESNYNIAHGYKHDSQVVYGDTDSVFVKFGTKTVQETFPLAIEAADRCSDIFPDPILLEFEKVYYPFLLMNKKRYAGLMWTNQEKYDYMDTKGLETVRRDNCALVREVIQTSLDQILIEQNVQGAIDYVKTQISDLLQNKMDISRLVITKSLNKGAEYALGLGGKKEDYKMKQAHVELAARMKKRDAGSAPQMGDRVPYVIITGAKGAANFEKAEDPIYVLENNIPIDCKWYLSNQLSKPLTRIFEPVIEDVEKTLLKGDHTRKIYIPTPTARKGSLMMFAKKTNTCMGCKVSLGANDGYLCKHCLPKEAEIYLEKLEVLREAEKRYGDLWSKAQRIHGTMHSEIMCTGDGCACQFYRRKKAQADIRLASEALNKFAL